MNGVLQLAMLVSRSRRMRAYQKVKAEIDSAPPSALADMGMKRAQAATVARKLALK